MARICMIRQGDYPLDPRIRSEADALVAAGHEVDIICRSRPGEPAFEARGAITVRRIGAPRHRGGWKRYLLDYARFMLHAGALAGRLHLRRRYQLVQVNTIPDTLVFAALVPKLLGARLLIDLPECMPEFVASKFGLAEDHPAVRLVARLEQLSIRLADVALTCTEPMRQRFISRGTPGDKLAIVMNSYGLDYAEQLAAPPAARSGSRFVLICHGTIEERYGLDTLVQAVALVRDQVPEIRLEIYGDGAYRPSIAALIERLELAEHVYLSPGWVPFEQLLQAIASADVGVVAMQRDPFRDLVLCTKLFDFIGLGTPAIVSRTDAVEHYFGQDALEFFTAGNVEELATAIRRLHADPQRRRLLAERARLVSEPYRWRLQSEGYLQIVASLLKGEAQPRPGPVEAQREASGIAS